MPAKTIAAKKVGKKDRVTLNAKVSPALAEAVHGFKEDTGHEVTAIVVMALEEFFDGSKWAPDAEADDDLDE